MVPFVFGAIPPGSELEPIVPMARAGLNAQLNTLYTVDQTQAAAETLDFLGEQFLTDSGRAISAYIAHTHLYVDHPSRPDMFLYPSVKRDRMHANFAVQPNSLHKLEMTRVFTFEMTRQEASDYALNWLTVRRNHDGVLDRRILTDSDAQFLNDQLSNLLP